MKDAIQRKYNLIRYYYTGMFRVSDGLQDVTGGGSFWRPMFFDYPNDNNAYYDPKYNVLIGDSLKLSILSDKLGVNSTQFYFPEGKWCNVFNASQKCFGLRNGTFKTLPTKAYDSYMHMKEGSIIPYQDAVQMKIMNTETLKQHSTDFLVFLSNETRTDQTMTA